MRFSDCTRACAVALGLLLWYGGDAPAAERQTGPDTRTANLTVFIRGVPVGTEQTTVARTAEGWTLTTTGRLGPPVDMLTRRLQIRYTIDWKPVELTLDGTARGQLQSFRTTVSGTTAVSEIGIGAQATERRDTVGEDALLLPNPFFGPYEALSIRLATAAPGTMVSAYQAPTMPFQIRVGDSTSEQIQTASAMITARHTHIELIAPGLAPVEGDLWGDPRGRLLRLSLPSQSLEVVREDIASVAARRVTVSRPNDESVKIPANGFVLAGTLSRPLDSGNRPLPAVVLIPGSGQTDRDETAFGIPIFGQLAGALADAGFAVLRYDKRGIGQSGGRAESASLADFADDVRAAVKFMTDRKDIDEKHVAIAGHSEGGAIAMIAAAGDKRIAAVALIASIGTTGAELNMAQVKHQLERSTRSDAEKQATIDMQTRIQQAVLTGKGWETIPPALRAQADTIWFQSLLAFDPAKVMPEVKQPILIVQGALDTQVDPSNADQLEKLARARKKAGAVEVVKIPGVNHLLVSATTGEADEYAMLKEKRVSPAVISAISTWLEKTFAVAAK